MWTLFSVLYAVTILSLSLVIICGAAYILQLVLERFILNTLPLMVELYARIRYPKDFKE
jgi:hypothetical protein